MQFTVSAALSVSYPGFMNELSFRSTWRCCTQPVKHVWNWGSFLVLAFSDPALCMTVPITISEVMWRCSETCVFVCVCVCVSVYCICVGVLHCICMGIQYCIVFVYVYCVCVYCICIVFVYVYCICIVFVYVYVLWGYIVFAPHLCTYIVFV
jgi:hypothetical protein